MFIQTTGDIAGTQENSVSETRNGGRIVLEDSLIGLLDEADFMDVKSIERLGQKSPWSDDALLQELTDNHAFHFGFFAEQGTRLTSFILSRMVLDEVHIHHVCTLPDFRRKGFARKLLNHVIETARSQSAEKAFLEVAGPNIAARDLYAQAGFKKDYVRKKYYSTGDDAIVMSRSLKV